MIAEVSILMMLGQECFNMPQSSFVAGVFADCDLSIGSVVKEWWAMIGATLGFGQPKGNRGMKYVLVVNQNYPL